MERMSFVINFPWNWDTWTDHSVLKSLKGILEKNPYISKILISKCMNSSYKYPSEWEIASLCETVLFPLQKSTASTSASEDYRISPI